ncbi:PAP/OAS1 substrate-binding domain superfamily [Prunus dulcis]|uniref:PAP/OAS1 substrate-binding domain superfamily n=1 Tax=Prunus dulcis TaxID=3755 RepID=A0A4Y1S146_PRUDU|nr:PAP/OAS1 substrate-binding domain superfamily [Prunus dulcis]
MANLNYGRWCYDYELNAAIPPMAHLQCIHSFRAKSHGIFLHCDPWPENHEAATDPPCPRPDLALGLTPHSDASALTLLMQFDPGLRRPPSVERHEMGQCDLATRGIAGECGDLLEIMSNGRLKSPWHRVVTKWT